MRFIYKAVERLPKALDGGVVYHSKEFEVAALLCACGCGHRVSLLVPDSHQLYSEDGLATIRPSISVCDAPCKSHYIVTAGEVDFLPAFSAKEASLTMRSQIARHAAVETKHYGWRDRIKGFFGKALQVIRSVFAR